MFSFRCAYCGKRNLKIFGTKAIFINKWFCNCICENEFIREDTLKIIRKLRDKK